MTIVRGCNFPDTLYYDVPRHVWYAPAQDGLVRAGMTVVGVALAREVIVFTPKRAGTSVDKGKAFATVESAKWIGSVRGAFDASVAGINDQAAAQTRLINEDCYGEGWMVLLAPAHADWRAQLVTGNAISEAYEAWMENEAWPGCK